MGLGLSIQNTGTNEFEPWVKYDARAGRWFKMDRIEGAEGWQTKATDITMQAVFVADFRNINVGWVDFSAQGPDYKMVPVGQPQPERPGVKHRQGFRLSLFSERNLDGSRVWMHNAKCVINKIDALYDVVTAAPEYAAGQLPVIQMTGTESIRPEGKDDQGKKVVSTNYAPMLSIVQWVPSPFEAAPAVVVQQVTPVAVAAFNAPLPAATAPVATANGPLF